MVRRTKKPKTTEPSRPPRLPPIRSREAWYPVMVFRQDYSAPVNAEDRKHLRRVRKKIESSDLGAERRNKVMEYLEIGEKSRSRFTAMQTEAIAEKYVDGLVTDEGLDFQIRLINAWEKGKLKDFIQEEKKALLPQVSGPEAERLGYMLDIAEEVKDDIIRVVALSLLKVYYPKADTRAELIEDAVLLLEAA